MLLPASYAITNNPNSDLFYYNREVCFKFVNVTEMKQKKITHTRFMLELADQDCVNIKSDQSSTIVYTFVLS